MATTGNQAGQKRRRDEDDHVTQPIDEQVQAKRIAMIRNASGALRIGYRDFAKAEDAVHYFGSILKSARLNRDLGAYETFMVVDLVVRGHPQCVQKMEDGVVAVTVRSYKHEGRETKCFYLVRADGSFEDFSYRKCISYLWPTSEDKQQRGGGKKKEDKVDEVTV